MKKIIYVLLCLLIFLSCKKEDNVIIGWEKVNPSAMDGESIMSIAVSGTTVYVVNSDTKNNFYKSVDNGANWILVTGIPDVARSVIIRDQYVFIGTGGGIYRSADNGANWSAVNVGFPLFFGNLTGAYPFTSDNKLFAFNSGSIFSTTNNGEDWEKAFTSLDKSPIDAFTIIGTNYIAGNWGGIYQSANNGVTWASTNKIFGYVKVLDVVGNNVVVGTSSGLYYSVDNGVNWLKAKISDGNSQSPSVRCLVVSGKNIYAGTESYGMYRSTDSGITWSTFNTSFSDSNTPTVLSCTIYGNYIYAGTHNGLWKRKL
jgi:photosystem II stability/assembly factor-like uncharacterized protein